MQDAEFDNLITAIAGLEVGNAEDEAALTGVTVLHVPGRARAAVDVRGGAPGTRETDALDPLALAGAVDAVVLAGGSVYGLEAASAICAELGARGQGLRLTPGALPAPIVPAAILFDLTNGGAKDWGAFPPYGRLGRLALARAGRGFALGNAGAGYGARAGAYKGGLGSAARRAEDGITVGALIAANPVGSPVMPGSGRLWAAPFASRGELGAQPPGPSTIAPGAPPDMKGALQARPGMSTTIGIIATDADLSAVELKRLAIMAQDGLARAVRPIHTPLDGDTVFALATGRAPLAEPRPRALALLGALAADVTALALARGVFEAASLPGMPAYRDVFAAALAPPPLRP